MAHSRVRQLVVRWHSRLVAAACAAVLGFITGLVACDRLEPASEGSTASAGAPPETVRATFDHLRAAHERGAYLRLWDVIDPAPRQEVIGVLVVVDELLAANAAALEAIASSCPECNVAAFDLAPPLQNNLGIFSKDVDYVDDDVDGDRGIVTIQIAGRLPLERVVFERRGDGWVYVPEASQRGLMSAIRDAARGLERIPLVLRKRTLTPEQVVEEYQIRVIPKLDRIRERSAASQPS